MQGEPPTQASTPAGSGLVSSLKRWVSLRAYGLVTRTLFGARTSPLTMRARFERFARVSRQALQRKFPGLVFQDHTTDGIAIESVCAVEAPARVILYLHGGVFFMGSPASYRNRTMRLSYRCDAEVFVPAYRLAPENPFPAALEDAVAAWKFVKALRGDAPVFVAGDSAGGGLSLSLLLRVGEDELLLDDALRVRSAAAEKGTNASVLIGKGMQHDWPLTLPWLEESRAAWRTIRAFVEEHSHSRRANAQRGS